MSLVSQKQIDESPNNKWGEVTVPVKGGGRRTLSPVELARLGLHTVYYEGDGRWRNPRKNPTAVPETDIDAVSRGLADSDAKYEAAVKRHNERNSGFFGKLRRGAGTIMGAATSDPKAKASLMNIAQTASVGDVARGVVRNPALKVIAGAASIVFPPAAAIGAAIVAADKAATAIAKGDVAGAIGAVAEGAGGVGVQLPPVVGEALKNPTVQTLRGAVALPEGLLSAAAQGGVVAAVRDASAALGTPARAAGVRAVAANVETLGQARKLVDELEQKDAAKASKTAAQVGATLALAKSGDATAKKSAELIARARAERSKLSGLTPEAMDAFESLWSSDPKVREYPQAVRTKVRPARVRTALEVALALGFMPRQKWQALSSSAKTRVTAKAQAAVDVLAAVMEAARAHKESPYFTSLGGVISGELQRLTESSSPYAVTMLRALEKKVGVKMARRSSEVNKLVRSYNKKEPGAVKFVTELKTRTAAGDDKARQGLDEVRRRAAALRAAEKFTVSADGIVRKVG